MTQGRIIKLGKGITIKDGKVSKKKTYKDASQKIRERKSKKQKVVRRTP